jgi:hypothetical protein
MDDTKSPQVGLWFAIAGVLGVIALLSGLDTVLSSLPFILDPVFNDLFSDEVPAGFVIYFLSILITPLSIAVFVAALTKRSGLALYGSIAILFSSVVWRLIWGAVFGGSTTLLPFVALFWEYAFWGFSLSVSSVYSALDIPLAGALLVLTILQHRRRQPSEFGSPLRGGAAGRASGTILCKMCGTPGVANQFCQGCGSKLQPPV